MSLEHRPFRVAGRVLAVLVATLAAGCGGGAEEPAPMTEEERIEAEARRIHDAVMTLCTHIDIPFNYATEEVDPGNVNEQYQVDYPRMQEGGLDAGFFVVYNGQGERTPEGYEAAREGAMTKFDAIHRATSTHSDVIELAYSADDAERIHAEGKLVAMIGVENGYPIGRDLSLLETYHELGARYLGLVHNGHNDLADSCNPREDLGDGEAEHGGLSDFGREAIAELNRLGMLVDVSHISRDAMLQAAEVSAAPIIASHSSATALADVSRNMDDEQLRALAANGGVMQTVALRSFVKTDPPEKTAAIDGAMAEFGVSSFGEIRNLSEEDQAGLRARLTDISAEFPVTVADFVDHIDHAIEVMGIDHVGISSDFDGGGGVDGWDDASETFSVTLELVRRGYSEDQIAQLWSGNTLRILREAERVAAEMQAEGE
ncbi:MAG: membrane dipeptidase [Acidobacteria bacterium]|nr:membrane dipeptidase [Acidobacteriota bacterium]MYE43271.1 membrane dipeptidase [Acidobacteriota bacterium]